jgi:SWI/SNF-related matrix-associated actin-dependent regulator of chromatin subfamily A-like protein 1
VNLFQFQREGAAWLATRRRALLADECGVGKTVEALAAHRIVTEGQPLGDPLVIVCPSIVKSVWAEHIRIWLPQIEASVFSGRGTFSWPTPMCAAVVNYEILPTILASSRPGNGTTLIADEAHYLKNPDAYRTRKFRTMAELVLAAGGRVWLLTGTPIANEPCDLWHLLEAAGLAEKAFTSWTEFRRIFGAKDYEFEVMTRRGRPVKITKTKWGRPDRDAARAGFDRVGLRRTKAQVLDQLPPKLRRTVEVGIPDKARGLCDAAVAGLEAEGRDPVKVLAAMEKETGPIAEARLALAAAKVEGAMELAKAVEEGGGVPIVFSAHRAPVVALGAKMPGWAAISGSTPPTERAGLVQRFQRGELRGLAATIGAAGVGITLTRATELIFLDLAWTPAENLQAEDRACRIGQRGSVVISTLVADHKLDRIVLAALSHKSEAARFLR